MPGLTHIKVYPILVHVLKATTRKDYTFLPFTWSAMAEAGTALRGVYDTLRETRRIFQGYRIEVSFKGSWAENGQAALDACSLGGLARCFYECVGDCWCFHACACDCVRAPAGVRVWV